MNDYSNSGSDSDGTASNKQVAGSPPCDSIKYNSAELCHSNHRCPSPHHREHHGPQPISPPPPSPQISAAELLILTEASATNNGTFQCTLCNKQFGYKNGLIRHVRLTHVGEKPYQCSICNRRFGYKHILMEHQNLHFGNRPYACTLCDKRFAARSNLIQHRMVHRRPFNCTLCNKRFDREDQLKKHLFAHPQQTSSGQDVVSSGTNSKNGLSTCEFMLEHDRQKDKPVTDESTEFMAGMDEPKNALVPLLRSHFSAGRSFEATGEAAVNTSVTDSSLQQQQSVIGLYQNVVVKKEVTDATDCVSSDNIDIHRMRVTESLLSPRKRSSLFVTPLLVPGQLATDNKASQSWSLALPQFGGNSQVSVAPVTHLTSKREHMSPAALPGIHEMFSRRAAASEELPSFSNLLPIMTGVTIHPPGVVTDLNAMSAQSSTSCGPFASAAVNAGGLLGPTQRPTAQLPPIAQPVHRSTKDQAVQHSQTVTGFPSLDDVLAYYVSQGRLFRCQHCSILFFERGMYFLHASLHGLASPWECSICHKVCSDKNEFTLHFVNQQHHS